MMRLLATLLLALLLAGMVSAQDEESRPNPYQRALRRIELAAINGDTELWLNGLSLTEVPPELWDLTQLRVLYLGAGFNTTGTNNRLTQLPPEIGNLTNLEFLDLRGNLLSSLPREIGQLVNLRELYLDHNRLTGLPDEIGNLNNLNILSIAENDLIVLPDTMGGLQSLYFLNLYDNALHDLPNSLGTLSELEAHPVNCHVFYLSCSLHVDGNPLTSIPQEISAQGSAAILAYLRNEAWWHLQKLIVSGLAVFGLVTLFVLAMRWRNLRGKQKRKNDA